MSTESTDSAEGIDRSADRSDSAGPSVAAAVDGLVSQLRVIEDQPLDSRAAAFAQLHDRLQSTLEGGDSPHRHA